ncbi:orotidine-5'-phosphate decarboxylase [Chelatococcus sp. SYSU_G07232]|uniref:Orotidine 5'-phosphate decarboxylase n=1 Tax=Chelatococcus albus TaxID=3047466 RepID=A0ABT7AHQ1_9HYPH|nr:orotidine-5'-phosphate decarboxylase [Chelatococcus sp. SYSU_G07232]MDJ1158911.1 orotidine-5'-phosphate decarboxylase [Chelatococcus sp. SYSU_G07232]
MNAGPDARDRLIVALDTPTVAEAEALVARLGDAVTFYKIGMEVVYGGGLALAEHLVGAGKKVFLDLKLHDIPNTVERATAQVARLGVTLLTVHGYPQTMKAAVRGRGESALKLLAVTVMTSCDDADLAEAGYAAGVRDTVRRRALQAREAGIDGLILSAEEAGAMRALLGAGMLLVTPGIRPAGSAVGDQKRVMTPAEAIRAGADHLVVGRPVTAAADPRAAAEAIVAEIADAVVSV